MRRRRAGRSRGHRGQLRTPCGGPHRWHAGPAVAMVGWHPGAARVVRAVRARWPAPGRLEPPQHRGATMATIEKPATYEPPGRPGSPVELKERYDNFIGGEWTPPETGEYRENLTPATGEPFCEVAYSTPADIELALDAAHAAKDAWGETLRRRARRRAERHRRRDRGQPRDARGRRELGERQAGARDARRRHPAGGRPLPLLRRRDPRRGGARSPRSTSRPSPTTSASRWASSARSSRSTSRC